MLIAVKRRAVEYFIVFGRRWLAIAIGVCNFPKCPVTTVKFNFGASAQKKSGGVFCTFVLLHYLKIVALLPVAFVRE